MTNEDAMRLLSNMASHKGVREVLGEDVAKAIDAIDATSHRPAQSTHKVNK
jgi:hypothetical protein